MENEVKIRKSKDGKIEARIPWADGRGPISAKSVEGYRFQPDSKTWKYPLTWKSAVGLRRVANDLGMQLVMSDGIVEWGRAEKVKRAASEASKADVSSEAVPDLFLVKRDHPKLWEAMASRPFQARGVNFMAGAKEVLLADDPGLGKTLQTIALMIQQQVTGPILVVANKSAATISWPNEIAKWAPNDRVIQFGTNIQKRHREGMIRKAFEYAEAYSEEATPRRVWVVMNPYWVRAKAETDQYGKYVYDAKGAKNIFAEVPELFLHEWGAIVADESHETLACNTGNAKKWSQQRQGLGMLKCSGPKVSISGTPMRGKPENMFGHLQWLRPQEYTSFWNWAKAHFHMVGNYSGFGPDEEIGELKDENAFYESISDLMLRRVKSEVAPDLPPKQYGGAAHPNGDVVGVWLPMAKEQKKQYDHFVAQQEIVGDEETLDAIGVLAIYTRMKQLATTSGTVGTRKVPVPMLDDEGNQLKDDAGAKLHLTDAEGNKMLMDEAYFIPALPSNKYEWLTEWLTERDLVGPRAKGKGKVIIASQFRSVIDLMQKDLQEKHKTESFAITGSTSAKARVAYQDEFQNNPDSPKIFFVQSKAGGTSLTLDMADDVIILDEMWDPDVQAQVEDRAHRLSRKHNVSIWYLRSLDTIEEHIGTTVEERAKTCRAIMDGSRGVEVERKLLGKEAA